MARINLNEYDLLPFDLEKCKAGHLTVMRSGEVVTFASVNTENPGIHESHRLLCWTASSVALRCLDGKMWDGGWTDQCDLFLAVKKPAPKTQRLENFRVEVRPGLVINMTVEFED
jgi:hypothetical protein